MKRTPALGRIRCHLLITSPFVLPCLTAGAADRNLSFHAGTSGGGISAATGWATTQSGALPGGAPPAITTRMVSGARCTLHAARLRGTRAPDDLIPYLAVTYYLRHELAALHPDVVVIPQLQSHSGNPTVVIPQLQGELPGTLGLHLGALAQRPLAANSKPFPGAALDSIQRRTAPKARVRMKQMLRHICWVGYGRQVPFLMPCAGSSAVPTYEGGCAAHDHSSVDMPHGGSHAASR